MHDEHHEDDSLHEQGQPGTHVTFFVFFNGYIMVHDPYGKKKINRTIVFCIPDSWLNRKTNREHLDTVIGNVQLHWFKQGVICYNF